MVNSLQKHEALDDVLAFERLVLYPLILKPRAEPYHIKKLRKKESFSPLCGPCIADENKQDQDANANIGRKGQALPGLALTPSSLQRASVGLHNFFHDRGFHHMRLGKHERAMSDAVSSGGGIFSLMLICQRRELFFAHFQLLLFFRFSDQRR